MFAFPKFFMMEGVRDIQMTFSVLAVPFRFYVLVIKSLNVGGYLRLSILWWHLSLSGK